MLKNKVIQADGVVQGSIQDNGSATVEAQVNCIDSVPTGSISGTAQFFGGGPNLREFSFSSNSPLIVATLGSIQSLGVAFENVTLQEDAFTPITGCSAFLNATRLNSSQWVGSFVVTCPSGEKLFFYGTFNGDILINRTVFCQPLL